MRLKNLFSVLAVAALSFGCSKENSVAEIVKTSATSSDNLLLRVHFAGSAALTGNSNATYLTALAALPESAALTTQLCTRVAALPARLLSASPTNDCANLLKPVLAEMIEGGFILELRGGDRVTEMALAAKGTAKQSQRWNTALADAAKNWFGTAPTSSADAGLIAGGGALRIKESNGWTILAISKTDASNVLAAILFTLKSAALESNSVMQAELSSKLVPGPVQRSVYGGFDRLKLTVTPSEQNLKIRGTASYSHDLPVLKGSPVIPTNLITESAISFTIVRQPGNWLEPKSALRRFLPDPMPDTAFFWGGESSPYQLVMIVPFAGGRDVFNNSFGPALLSQLEPLAKAMDTGSLILDTNRAGIQWQGVPFIGPQVTVKSSGTNNYLVAEVFPPNDFPPGLTPALLERVSGVTNLVLYDWEFTQLRFDTWFRIGQFALFSSGHQQLGSETVSKQWIFAAQTNMVNGGSSFTEITQTGPRELSLNRRATLGFTSTELFWLANWLESTNFPAANFLMPTRE